ncbi:hypothetical protein ACJJTC_011213 [Scirpophaga incertulas]
MTWTSLLVVSVVCWFQFYGCHGRSIDRSYDPPKVTLKVPLIGANYKISTISINVHIPQHNVAKQLVPNHTSKQDNHDSNGDLSSVLVDNQPENEIQTRMDDDYTSAASDYEGTDTNEYYQNNDYEGNEEYEETNNDTETEELIDPRMYDYSSETEEFIDEDTTVLLEVKQDNDSNNLLVSASTCGEEADVINKKVDEDENTVSIPIQDSNKSIEIEIETQVQTNNDADNPNISTIQKVDASLTDHQTLDKDAIVQSSETKILKTDLNEKEEFKEIPDSTINETTNVSPTAEMTIETEVIVDACDEEIKKAVEPIENIESDTIEEGSGYDYEVGDVSGFESIAGTEAEFETLSEEDGSNFDLESEVENGAEFLYDEASKKEYNSDADITIGTENDEGSGFVE